MVLNRLEDRPDRTPAEFQLRLLRIISAGSRNLKNGERIYDHLMKIMPDCPLRDFVRYYIGEIQRIKDNQPADNVRFQFECWLNTWVGEEQSNVPANSAVHVDVKTGRAVILSVVPDVPEVTLTTRDSMLVITSFCFGKPGSIDLQPICTLIAHYWSIGGGSIFIAYDGSLHEYSMGSEDNSPRLILENRKMGTCKYVLLWPVEEFSDIEMIMIQGLANKQARGSVREAVTPQAIESYPLPDERVQRIRRYAVQSRMTVPLVSKVGAVAAHLKQGGIFFCQCGTYPLVNSMLRVQLEHAFVCAGGTSVVPVSEIDDNSEFPVWCSISKQQRELALILG